MANNKVDDLGNPVEIRVNKNDKAQLKRLGYLVIAVVIIVAVVAFNVVTSISDKKKVDPGGANLGSVDTSSIEASDDLIRDNVNNGVLDAINQENQALVEAAQRSDTSAVGSLFGAKQTSDATAQIELSGFKDELAELRAELEILQQNQNNNQFNRSGNSQVSVVDRYIAIDGVEYLSEDYYGREQSSFEAAIAKIEANQVRGVSQSSGDNTGLFANGTGAVSGGVNGRVSNGSNFQRSGLISTGGAINDAAAPVVGVAGRSVQFNQEIIPVTGQLEIGRLTLGLKSSIGGPAVVEMLSGPYQGTILFANSFNTNGKYINVEINRFCLPISARAVNGQRCGNINARLVDLDERVASVKGKRRSFGGIRIAGILGSAILNGIGATFRTTVQPTTIITEGVVSQVPREDLSTEELLTGALQEVGSASGDLLRNATNKEPLTTVRVDKEVGIMIFSPGIISADSTTARVLNAGIETNEQLSN